MTCAMCVNEASPQAADRLYCHPKPNSRVLWVVHGPHISLGDFQARLAHMQGTGRRITRRSTSLRSVLPILWNTLNMDTVANSDSVYLSFFPTLTLIFRLIHTPKSILVVKPAVRACSLTVPFASF